MPTITVPQKEVERQAGLTIASRSYKIFLANKGALTEASTAAQWLAVELATANGYAAVTGTTSAGSWNSGAGRWDLGEISAVFTASGAGFTYDTVVVRLASDTYPFLLIFEDSPITLGAGVSRTYPITLYQKR